METQFRPYSIVAKVPDNTAASSIELRDTNGDFLFCNYVSVEGSGSNGFFFAVTYDAKDATTPAANQSIAANMIGDTSGATGAIAKANGGIVELLLSDADRVNKINISHTKASEQLFMITYGQIQSGSTLRDNDRPVGK